MVKLSEKRVLSVLILTILVFTSWVLLNVDKQPPDDSGPLIPIDLPEPTGDVSVKEYIFDDELGFGFEYPDGWRLHSSAEGFPDEAILKVVSFEKLIKIKLEGSEIDSEVSVSTELIVKSATDLQQVKDEFRQRALGVSVLNETMISDNEYDILIGEEDGWKLRQVAFFTDGIAYVFTYQSQDELYRLYEDTFNEIIDSFTVGSQ